MGILFDMASQAHHCPHTPEWAVASVHLPCKNCRGCIPTKRFARMPGIDSCSNECMEVLNERARGQA